MLSDTLSISKMVPPEKEREKEREREGSRQHRSIKNMPGRNKNGFLPTDIPVKQAIKGDNSEVAERGQLYKKFQQFLAG